MRVGGLVRFSNPPSSQGGKEHSGLIILGGLTGICKYESWVKKEEGGVRITTTAATTLGEEPSGTLVIGVT